ncbi:MAG: transglycosylase SLT domain-containing protein [Elusimicrobiota bacterium]
MLLIGLLSAVLSTTAAAQSPSVPEAAVSSAPANGTDGHGTKLDLELLEKLDEAEALYDEAVLKLRDGDSEGGKAALRKCFGLMASSIEDGDLSAELRDDLLNMMEKIRTWERGETAIEAPSELDIPAEELASAATAQFLAPSPKRRKHIIPIDPENPVTKKYVEFYTSRRKESVEQALGRSGRYRKLIESALAKAGLPKELFYLVMAESEYKLNAMSRAGAAGLWQFMPFTGRKYGLEVSYWVDERFDPEKATRAAIRYLSDLHSWFKDWHLAMAAYNRGEGGIGRDLEFTRSTDFGTLSDRNGLPRETDHYVPKFMACVLVGENPEAYGLHPAYEEPEPYDEVPIERDLDLGVAAACAGTTREVLQKLNPTLRSWCTPKSRPGFKLRIPSGGKAAFLENLAKVKEWNPGPQLMRYTVRKGDNLGKLSRQFRTSVKNIVHLNNLHSAKFIRPGMVLKIQPGKGYGGKRKK